MGNQWLHSILLTLSEWPLAGNNSSSDGGRVMDSVRVFSTPISVPTKLTGSLSSSNPVDRFRILSIRSLPKMNEDTFLYPQQRQHAHQLCTSCMQRWSALSLRQSSVHSSNGLRRGCVTSENRTENKKKRRFTGVRRRGESSIRGNENQYRFLHRHRYRRSLRCWPKWYNVQTRADAQFEVRFIDDNDLLRLAPGIPSCSGHRHHFEVLRKVWLKRMMPGTFWTVRLTQRLYTHRKRERASTRLRNNVIECVPRPPKWNREL